LKEVPPEPIAKYSWEKITQSLILNDPEKLKQVMDELTTYYQEQETKPITEPVIEPEITEPGIEQV
jgi:hypothetical protein